MQKYFEHNILEIGELKHFHEPRIFNENYSQIPACIILNGRIHIFYADRLDTNKSFIKYKIICLRSFKNIMEPKTFYCPERIGFFDTDGAMPSQIYQTKSEYFLTYNGWNRLTGTPPYLNSSGRIKINLNKLNEFEFIFAEQNPFLARGPDNPSSAVTPWIEKSTKNQMVYWIRTEKWTLVSGYYEPLYYIASGFIDKNGRCVMRCERIIEPFYSDEVFSRPSIVAIGDKTIMAFCSRSIRDFRDGANSYKINFAIKNRIDRHGWRRIPVKFNANLDWCNLQTSYPCLFSDGEKIYLAFNGNGFGKTGFGIIDVDKRGLLALLHSPQLH